MIRIGVRLLLGIIRMFKSTTNIYYKWTRQAATFVDNKLLTFSSAYFLINHLINGAGERKLNQQAVDAEMGKPFRSCISRPRRCSKLSLLHINAKAAHSIFNPTHPPNISSKPCQSKNTKSSTFFHRWQCGNNLLGVSFDIFNSHSLSYLSHTGEL